MSTSVGEPRHPEGGTSPPPMPPSRWDRITLLFSSALDLPDADRRPFLESRCGADVELLHEVLSLLASHDVEHELAVEARLLPVETALPVTLTPGTRVGPYEVLALAGEGGMGEVYRAARVDGAYHQTVAIKVLRSGFLTAETVRRFRLEREVLARLVHPNIASILDAGTAPDGRPYLVLQFVDGIPITDFANGCALTIRERVALVRRVADAVHFAHSHLVVHRDLKPSNILVEPNGDPKLLDFGVAKLLDDDRGNSIAVATRPETRILTPEHAAPEQLRGERVSTATDVYALGVLLCELLAGQRPFRSVGKTRSELEEAILQDAPPLASTLAPASRARQLRGDLDRIVAMALRKEPDRRYASANQLSEDLGRYLAGEPVLAERETLRYRAIKFVGRNRVLVTSVAASLVVLGGAAVTMTLQARRLSAERDRVVAERAAADDLLGMVTRLFDRANPMKVPGGDTVRVSELLREAERQVDSLAKDPERRGRFQKTLGLMYYGRGEYPAAIRHLRGAWDALRQARGEQDSLAVQAYFALATAVNLFEGAASAETLLDSAIVRLRGLEPLNPSLLADALQQRALTSPSGVVRRQLLDEAYALRQRPGVDSIAIAAQLNAEASAPGRTAEERLTLTEESLRILTRLLPADHPNVITVRGNVVAGLIGTGHYARAESLARTIQEGLPRTTAGETIAVGEERLALLAALQGRHDEAEAMMRTSLARVRTALGDEHWRVSNSQRNLAVIVAARGRVAEGLVILDSAIAHYRAGGPTHRGSTGYMIGQRGRLLVRLGRLGEAQDALHQSRTITEEVLAASNTQHADIAQWLGELALARQDFASASREFDRALRRRSLNLPAAHPLVLESRCSHTVAHQGATGTVADSLGRQSCGQYARTGMPSSIVLTLARTMVR
jgi:eukaryotic-like serine/threonine-protein kinase